MMRFTPLSEQAFGVVANYHSNRLASSRLQHKPAQVYHLFLWQLGSGHLARSAGLAQTCDTHLLVHKWADARLQLYSLLSATKFDPHIRAVAVLLST